MKKIIWICTVIIILGSCSNNSFTDNDLTKDNLRGNVVSIVTIVYDAKQKFGEIVKDEVQTNLLQKNFIKTYNNKGYLLEFIPLFGMEPLIHYKMYYIKEGIIEYYDCLELNGELNSKFIHKYDQNGKLDKICKYNPNGELEFETNHYYNPSGDLFQTIKIDDNPIITQYEYIGDSIMIAEQFFHKGLGVPNILIDLKKFKNDKLFEKTTRDKEKSTYEYNKFGDISREYVNSYRLDTMLSFNIEYEYTYDEIGNWVKLIKYATLNNSDRIIPASVTLRDIVYWDKYKKQTDPMIIYNQSIFKREYDKNRLAKNEETYCNEETVIRNIKDYFEFYNPEVEIIENTIKISSLNNCMYKVRLIIQNRELFYIKKVIVLKFNYVNDFKEYEINIISESTY